MTEATKSREIALDVLMEVLEKGGFVHEVLRQALEKYQYLPKPDRALVTRLANGVVENLLAIDAVIGHCSTVKTEKLKPVVRTILRMSVYQILWMDRIPDSAVCNQAVKLAGQRRFTGLKGFVNGVLRTVARQKGQMGAMIAGEDTPWAIKYSMPQWLIDMWREAYPDQAVERLLQAFLEEAPTTVRCNRSLACVEDIKRSLKRQGVEAYPSRLCSHVLQLGRIDYLERLEAFQKGWIQVQDAASALVGEAASPRPGDRILDLCGAPGGKSLDMADRLNGSGLVALRDVSEGKVALARSSIARAGFTNIRAEVWDALEFDPCWEEKADLVVADLPCSGLGVIGKKPDIKYRVTAGRIGELEKLQRGILSVAARYVKPGGKLVYSTCTISRRENEGQRDWFLANFPFEGEGLEGLGGEAIGAGTLKEGYIQLLPGQHPCDGFFIAAFRRKKQD